MVNPIEKEREKTHILTLEQRLANKFDELQIARESKSIVGYDTLFDELSKSIIVLFKSVPDAYNRIATLQMELDKKFEEEARIVYQEVQNAKDPIDQEFLMNQRMENLRWEYREIIEEIIMETMQEYDLIDMKRPPQYSVISQQNPTANHNNTFPAQPEEPPVSGSQPIPEPLNNGSQQSYEPQSPVVQESTELKIEDKPMSSQKKKLRFAFRKQNE